MTEYEYDEDGRLIRAVTTRESEWTEQDRAEMFALDLYRYDLLCPCGCGFLAEYTLADEKAGPLPATFEASRVVCHARLARAQAMANADDPKQPQPVSAQARIWTTYMHKINRR